MHCSPNYLFCVNSLSPQKERKDLSTSAQSELFLYFHSAQSSTKCIMKAQQVLISGFPTCMRDGLSPWQYTCLVLTPSPSLSLPICPPIHSHKGNLFKHRELSSCSRLFCVTCRIQSPYSLPMIQRARIRAAPACAAHPWSLLPPFPLSALFHVPAPRHSSCPEQFLFPVFAYTVLSSKMPSSPYILSALG